jgi:hypothetical protein
MFITSPRAFAERFNEKIPDACRKINPMMCVVDHAEDVAEKPDRRGGLSPYCSRISPASGLFRGKQAKKGVTGKAVIRDKRYT